MKRFFSGTVAIIAFSILLIAPGLQAPAHAVIEQLLTIDGAPLEIHAFEDSTMGVFRWQQDSLVQQYYDQYAKGSVIFLNGTDTAMRWGGGTSSFSIYENETDHFTPVTHTKLNDRTIQTVFDAGLTGVRITQTISYINGNSYYQITWQVANTGQATYNDVRFIHGGDTYFAGDDDSEGHWDQGLGMVYLTNPDPGLTGIMGFYGSINSPADHYNEDNYYTVLDYTFDGQLPDTVQGNDHDAGYALQWNRSALAPRQTWTITAFEKWTEAGFVQVFAPADTPILPGQTVSLNFIVQNYQDVEDTFDLQLAATNEWPAAVTGGAVTIGANSQATVEVTVTAPENEQDGSENILTLTATSRMDEEIFNNDATAVRVKLPATSKTILPGSNASQYEMMSFIHYPLNPSATSVLGFPVDENENQVGTYNAMAGGYVKYGPELQIMPGEAYWALSRAGFTPSFIGDRVPVDEDFQLGLAYNEETQNGWNQIGTPNGAEYAWEDVIVVVYDGDDEILFGPVPIGELDDPNNYIDLRLWRWNNGAYSDDTVLLEVYEGYWARAKHENVFLIFPVDAQLAGIKRTKKILLTLKNKTMQIKNKVFSPKTAFADDGDTPPLPMADFAGSSGEASSGGGCFIEMMKTGE